MEENLKALEIELTPQDLRRIDEAFPTESAVGKRYPEHMMALVNR